MCGHMCLCITLHENTSGHTFWKCFLEIHSGDAFWKCILEIHSGNTFWAYLLEIHFGNTFWHTNMSTLLQSVYQARQYVWEYLFRSKKEEFQALADLLCQRCARVCSLETLANFRQLGANLRCKIHLVSMSKLQTFRG